MQKASYEQIRELSFNVTQAGHNLTNNLPVVALRLTSGQFLYAEPNPINKATHVAVKIFDVNRFQLLTPGFYSVTHGLPQYTKYYLDPDNFNNCIPENSLDNFMYRQLIFTTLDADTLEINLGQIEQPFVNWAKIRNIQQTNLNDLTTGVQMQFDIASFQGNTRFFAANTEGIEYLGTLPSIKGSASDYETSVAGARQNVQLRLTVNEIIQAGASSGVSGYIRRASGHNEAGTLVRDPFLVNQNDLIGVDARRLAATGVVTTVAGRSNLLLELP